MLSHLSDAELQELHTLLQHHKLPKNDKRRNDVIEHNYSTKFLMHVVRLALECEQLLTTGQLELDRDSQTYQSIRRGDWTLEHGKRWWESKERDLETLYANSKVLPRKPDEEAIKQLLLNCLETHFGSISTAVQRNPSLDNVLNDLHAVLNKYR